MSSKLQTTTLSRVYFDALRSLSDTKDTLILVCIGLLEALDRLQERLHLPSSIVKELKRRLAKMVSRSSVRPQTKRPSARELGDVVADSSVWDSAEPEHVRGVVHWLLAAATSLQRLVINASLGVCDGIYGLVMSLPGVSTACSLLNGLLQAVEDTLRLSSEEIIEAASAGGSGLGSGRTRDFHRLHHHRHRRSAENYMVDPSLTAVVLEYKEKESMVPLSIDRRIRRVMHFQIPLHSFEATVRLPPDNVQSTTSWSRSTSDDSVGGGNHNRAQEETTSSYAHLSSSTPRSIPVSPLARKRVQLAFSNFSDDVLYQVRDRLRQEHVATLTGDPDLRVPRFNAHDCHEDIYLSCGRHCASKVGTGMYRSVRASVPLQKNRFVYFEMTLQQGRAPLRGVTQSASGSRSGSSFSQENAAGINIGSAKDRAGIDASVCIGLSTRLMPLNTLVGASKHSIGFYSAGHVLVGSERRSSIGVGRKYGFQSTVGVLARVVDHLEGLMEESSGSVPHLASASFPSSSSDALSSIGVAFVRFTVDGIAVRDSNNRVMEFRLPFPSRSELYPTLTLHSQDVHVFSQMSVPDISKLDVQELDLLDEEPVEIWCLDGLRIGVAV
ncbi:unnamed protein product [Peronospora destructor]|uniref:Uncharacterized protein n=1 Tax=Peronospora destructor TaxID=86335 RepID=A0AAV0UBT9_9STRA|nr:unnamed protein product [Peronospora destructor]